MKSPVWIVYGVIDPGSNMVVYVGVTTNLQKRLRERAAALALESALITALPQIYNKTHDTERENFWYKIRGPIPARIEGE